MKILDESPLQSFSYTNPEDGFYISQVILNIKILMIARILLGSEEMKKIEPTLTEYTFMDIVIFIESMKHFNSALELSKRGHIHQELMYFETTKDNEEEEVFIDLEDTEFLDETFGLDQYRYFYNLQFTINYEESIYDVRKIRSIINEDKDSTLSFSVDHNVGQSISLMIDTRFEVEYSMLDSAEDSINKISRLVKKLEGTKISGI